MYDKVQFFIDVVKNMKLRQLRGCKLWGNFNFIHLASEDPVFQLFSRRNIGKRLIGGSQFSKNETSRK